jgi:hypothetical protein
VRVPKARVMTLASHRTCCTRRLSWSRDPAQAAVLFGIVDPDVPGILLQVRVERVRQLDVAVEAEGMLKGFDRRRVRAPERRVVDEPDPRAVAIREAAFEVELCEQSFAADVAVAQGQGLQADAMHLASEEHGNFVHRLDDHGDTALPIGYRADVGIGNERLIADEALRFGAALFGAGFADLEDQERIDDAGTGGRVVKADRARHVAPAGRRPLEGGAGRPHVDAGDREPFAGRAIGWRRLRRQQRGLTDATQGRDEEQRGERQSHGGQR